jgi:hypothetical protein
MSLDDLANRVLSAVKGDKEAIKQISEALVGRDPEEIKRVFSEVAKVELSPEELQMLVNELETNPSRIAAYPT